MSDSEWYYVRNWYKFQHYKDRNPPWIKLHRSFWTDPEIQSLSERDQLWLIKLWMTASTNDGRVPHVSGMCGASVRHLLGICGTVRQDYIVSMLARFESKGLISKDDIRGTVPHIASKVLAPKTEAYKEETETDKKVLKLFTAPSTIEVAEYMRDQGLSNPEQTALHFCDYYETRGWKPGGSKTQMKSWQAAVRTWKRNGINGGYNGTREHKSFRQIEEDRGHEQLLRLAEEYSARRRARAESNSSNGSLFPSKAH